MGDVQVRSRPSNFRMTADRPRLRHGRVTAAPTPAESTTGSKRSPGSSRSQSSISRASRPAAGKSPVAYNGAYTRFEIHFNEAEFSTIAGRGWSQGRNPPDLTHPARFPVGSIAVKAAWPPWPLRRQRRATRYYVERAESSTSRTRSRPDASACSTQDVALVGLHIVIKTRSRRQWVWSTFEYVHNVTPRGAGETCEPDARDAGARYSYFDPVRPMKLWPPLGSPGTTAGQSPDEPATTRSHADAKKW